MVLFGLLLRYTYKIDEVNNLAEVKGPFEKPYCVWDHVVLALHVKSGQVPSLLLQQEHYFIFIHLKAAAVCSPQLV